MHWESYENGLFMYVFRRSSELKAGPCTSGACGPPCTGARVCVGSVQGSPWGECVSQCHQRITTLPHDVFTKLRGQSSVGRAYAQISASRAHLHGSSHSSQLHARASNATHSIVNPPAISIWTRPATTLPCVVQLRIGQGSPATNPMPCTVNNV